MADTLTVARRKHKGPPRARQAHGDSQDPHDCHRLAVQEPTGTRIRLMRRAVNSGLLLKQAFISTPLTQRDEYSPIASAILAIPFVQLSGPRNDASNTISQAGLRRNSTSQGIFRSRSSSVRSPIQNPKGVLRGRQCWLTPTAFAVAVSVVRNGLLIRGIGRTRWGSRRTRKRAWRRRAFATSQFERRASRQRDGPGRAPRWR